jgi:dynein light chain LC8-type
VNIIIKRRKMTERNVTWVVCEME